MRLSVRRLVAAAAIAFVTFVGRRAGAEAQPVLFVASSSTPFGTRVQAEIEAMGFAIEPAASLDEVAPIEPVAAVRVVDGPSPRAELWIADAATHRLALHSVVAIAPEADGATETVRVSEELRAFFQPLRASPAPPDPVLAPPLLPPAPPKSTLVVDAPIASPAIVAPSPPRFAVAADLALVFQTGGTGVDLGVRGAWRPASMLSLGAFVDVPLAGSTVKHAQGSASVSAPLFGGEVAVLVDLAARLRLAPSAGLAFAWVRTSGFANAPYHGQPSDVSAAVPLLGGELEARATDRLWLTAGGRVGFSLPRVDIAFAGENVGFWGRPLGLVSAGARVDF